MAAGRRGNWFIVEHRTVSEVEAETRDVLAEAMQAALRRARREEAAHFDAGQDIRDAQTLRLYALKGDLSRLVEAHPDSRAQVDLVLQAGERPRLWIDLTSYVVMQPDPRTYRLIEDHREGHAIVAESTDRAAFTADVTDFIAHRVVARQRALEAAPGPARVPAGYSTAALILAWLAGFSLGVLALLTIVATFPDARF